MTAVPGRRNYAISTIRDIRFGNPTTVLLHGKGGKDRIVPLMSRPTKLLRQFISERKVETNEKDAPLFISQRGEPITPACIRNVIYKYVSRAKRVRPDLFNERSYSPHSFRHSKAVHLLEGGEELACIRDFLGHASIQTTEIYATVSQAMLSNTLRNRDVSKSPCGSLDEALPDTVPNYLKRKKK